MLKMKLIQKARGFLFDLDGVFVQSGKPLHGAIESLEVLRSLNIPFRFLTNTTTKSRMTLQNTLNSIGINCEEGEIFSAGFSGVLAIKTMGSPKCIFYITDDLKKDYLEFQEDIDSPDVIVIGDYESWNFEKIDHAFRCVMNGAKILALHMGKYYRVDSGLRIDAGAFVAALEFATNKKAMIVGKPNKMFFESALNHMGLDSKDVVMIGDDLVNDIYGAQELGIPGILVKSGKYHKGMLESSSIIPDGFLESIADLPKIISNGD